MESVYCASNLQLDYHTNLPICGHLKHQAKSVLYVNKHVRFFKLISMNLLFPKMLENNIPKKTSEKN